MKKACPSDFYLIGFRFFGNCYIFTQFFDFVCVAYMKSTTGNSDCDATEDLSCSAFYSPQLKNADGSY